MRIIFLFSLIPFIWVFSKCSAPVKPEKPMVAEKDSIHIGKKVLLIDSISEQEYNKVPIFDPSHNEKENLDASFFTATRQGNELVFKIATGDLLRLKNDTNLSDESPVENYVVYKYLAYFREIGFWLVEAGLYESYEFIMISEKTGEKTTMWGYPAISPDKKHVISANTDLAVGFTTNGLQLLDIADGRLNLVGERELKRWGPSGVRWFNENSLYVRQEYIDSNMTTGFYKYVKMDIR